MDRSSFGGSPFTPRGSPFTPRGSHHGGRGSHHGGRGSPYTPRGSGASGGGGYRGRATRFSQLVAGQTPSPAGLPDFTPSPGGGGRGRRGWSSPRGRGGFTPHGRGGFTPRGRGFGAPRGRGGHGGGLCFDDTFVRFATENPWAELERQKSVPSVLGPLNSGGGTRQPSTPLKNSPAPSPGQCQQQVLPVPDDDDSFV